MLDYTHLEALLAVEQHGSFEAAAKELGMSPIGVATRIRKLEERMGVLLLTRKPTRPTKAGDALCQYAKKVTSLEIELIEKQKSNVLQAPDEHQKLRIAINEENQLAWFLNILAELDVESSNSWLMDVGIIGQNQSIQHMKDGKVIAALSSIKQPVHGYKSHHLGEIDYMAVAAPAFINKHIGNDVDLPTLKNTPCIRTGDDDELCFLWLQQCFGKTVAINCFRMPYSQIQINQCCFGVGWAVLPTHAIKNEYNTGSLLELIPGSKIRKELYWHISAILAEDLKPLTNKLREVFAKIE